MRSELTQATPHQDPGGPYCQRGRRRRLGPGSGGGHLQSEEVVFFSWPSLSWVSSQLHAQRKNTAYAQAGPHGFFFSFCFVCKKEESTEKLSPFCRCGNRSTENEPRPPNQSRAGGGLEGAWTHMGHLTSSQQGLRPWTGAVYTERMMD